MIIIICAENYTHYVKPIIPFLDTKFEIISPKFISENMELILSAKLVFTIHSFLPEIISLFESLKGSIKTITLQDGIIEYKSSAHRFRGNYRYRPIASDKLLVFGEKSKQLVLSSGAKESQVIVTGCPRFDNIKKNQHFEETILVTMANRPGYGKENSVLYYELMEHLLNWLCKNNVKYNLRLSRGVSNIGQESIYKILDTPSETLVKHFNHSPSITPISEDIQKSNAVITTPSTVSLEAMLTGVPVCHFLPDPQLVYLQSAWQIRNKIDFGNIIPELITPPKMKLEFQELTLSDNISYVGSASKKVAEVLNSSI